MIVVTGRSHTGTSMLMHMLNVGGIRPIYDPLLQTEHDRKQYPHGYYETQWMPRIERLDLDAAPGTCAKVFFNEIPELLEKIRSKVSHVLITQRPYSDNPDWRKYIGVWVYEETMAKKALNEARMPCLTINYHIAIADPISTSKNISDFLDCSLDIEAMAKIPIVIVRETQWM